MHTTARSKAGLEANGLICVQHSITHLHNNNRGNMKLGTGPPLKRASHNMRTSGASCVTFHVNTGMHCTGMIATCTLRYTLNANTVAL